MPRRPWRPPRQWNLTNVAEPLASSRPRKLSPSEPIQARTRSKPEPLSPRIPVRPHHLSAIAARLGPPDDADRGNRAQVLDQHLVHGELGQPHPLAQPVRQVASSAGLRVASVPEEIDRSIGGELPPDDPQRLLRLMPEGRDVEGEDLVESLVPEVRLLERGRLQHCPASRDVLAIPTPG